jgi:hypothetical protein
MHDTPNFHQADVEQALPFFEPLLRQAMPAEPCETSSRAKRGRPREVPQAQIWLSLLISVLLEMRSYQELWRHMSRPLLAGFAPIQVSDEAIVKRLKQAGLAPLQHILARLSSLLASHLHAVVATDLAPFASRMVALDETTWDAVQRHLAPLCRLPDGAVGLLPSKLAARFDIRSQPWDFVSWRQSAQANCQVALCSLLHDLPLDSLLLFDLGYFSFPWFDYPTPLHYWFVLSSAREDHLSVGPCLLPPGGHPRCPGVGRLASGGPLWTPAASGALS